MSDQSYIGKGQIYMRKKGAAAPRLQVGNCSKLDLSPAVDKKELMDYTQAGGGQANTVDRIKGVGVSMTLHDLSSSNLAIGVYGEATAVTAATVTAEAQTAYLGGLVRTDFLIDTTATVTVKDSTDTTIYVVGTDYTVSAAGIIPLTGGAIVDASVLHIGYTKHAGYIVEAMLAAGTEYELVFDGLNEAQSGKPFVIDIYRFKPSPFNSIPLIGDDFAGLEISGDALIDSSITGTGLSRYFKASAAS